MSTLPDEFSTDNKSLSVKISNVNSMNVDDSYFLQNNSRKSLASQMCLQKDIVKEVINNISLLREFKESLIMGYQSFCKRSLLLEQFLSAGGMESVFLNYVAKGMEGLEESDLYNVYKINVFSEIIGEHEKHNYGQVREWIKQFFLRQIRVTESRSEF